MPLGPAPSGTPAKTLKTRTQHHAQQRQCCRMAIRCIKRTPNQQSNSPTHLAINMTGGRRSASIGSRPPDPCTTSPTYGLNTRRTTRSTFSQNDIEAMTNMVKDSESGKLYLTSKLICNIDQPFTLMHLISVLFQITQMSSATPLLVISAI